MHRVLSASTTLAIYSIVCTSWISVRHRLTACILATRSSSNIIIVQNNDSVVFRARIALSSTYLLVECFRKFTFQYVIHKQTL